jgi:hypothetical protein
MPSSRLLLFSGSVIASVAGCVEDHPAPDISNLSIAMRWQGDATRSMAISIVNPDIPCTEVEEGFLGDSAVQCTSSPWTLRVDGASAITSPVTCWSAHDGLFGHTPKRCEGGAASLILPEHASEDVEIVATTDTDEKRIVLSGVRRTFSFVQVTPFAGGEPGVIAVGDLQLVRSSFPALYLQSGVTTLRDFAEPGDNTSQLRLSPINLADGIYPVRVLGLASQGGATIAVPIEGSLAVGP